VSVRTPRSRRLSVIKACFLCSAPFDVIAWAASEFATCRFRKSNLAVRRYIERFRIREFALFRFQARLHRVWGCAAHVSHSGRRSRDIFASDLRAGQCEHWRGYASLGTAESRVLSNNLLGKGSFAYLHDVVRPHGIRNQLVDVRCFRSRIVLLTGDLLDRVAYRRRPRWASLCVG